MAAAKHPLSFTSIPQLRQQVPETESNAVRHAIIARTVAAPAADACDAVLTTAPSLNTRQSACHMKLAQTWRESSSLSQIS